MVLVLAVARVTCPATVLETRHSASQIPAARPLAEIAAQRAHVAECGRSHSLTRVREGGEAITDSGLARDVVQPRTGSDAKRTIGAPRHFFNARDGPEVNEGRGRRDSFLDAHQQVGAAAERSRARVREECRRFVD